MPGNFQPSELIAAADMTLAERQAVRQGVDMGLAQLALRLKIKDNPEDLVIRDTLPFTDLGQTPTAGANLALTGGTNGETWLITVAGVAGTELTWFSQPLLINQCIGFYGLTQATANPNITKLRFTQGPSSTTSRAVFHLEQLLARWEPVGYFSTAVLFARQQRATGLVTPKAAFAANTELLPLLARTVEPLGDTISAPILP